MKSTGCACCAGAYVPLGNDAQASAAASSRNLFKNADFGAGLDSWFFIHGPDKFNQRRTFERTSFALSRLLGNFGVSGSTPLLERFGGPVKSGHDAAVGRWLEGLYLTQPTEWDDPYRFFGW